MYLLFIYYFCFITGLAAGLGIGAIAEKTRRFIGLKGTKYRKVFANNQLAMCITVISHCYFICAFLYCLNCEN